MRGTRTTWTSLAVFLTAAGFLGWIATRASTSDRAVSPALRETVGDSPPEFRDGLRGAPITSLSDAEIVLGELQRLPEPLGVALHFRMQTEVQTKAHVPYPWGELEKHWQPTPESMRSWLEWRFKSIQDFVRDLERDGKDVKERLAHYGWDKPWPPVQGFPSRAEIDAVIADRYAEFWHMLKYRRYEMAAQDIAALGNVEYWDLADRFDTLADEVWNRIFAEGPYEDVIALCTRVGLD